VLRDAGRVLTIGGGEVLDPLPVRARRGDDRHLDLLRDLSSGDAASSLAALVGHAGAIEADLAAFRSGAYAAVQPGGPLPDGVRRLGGLLVADRRHDELAATMHSLVTGFHAANPLEPGMPRERLRSKLGLPSDAFDELLDDFPGIVGEGAVVRAADHRVALDPQQQRRTAEILELLERGGFSPPAPAELDADPALMRALADQGKVVRVGDFYLSAERARQAQDIVRDAIRGRGPLTVAEIRDLLGTSRKYAVPLCEWLDETGITRRRGDVRILGAKA
jgi:selenocysteine-specific elongation factor